MPSTYTLNNGIELIATGEQSGTWGDTTNTNLSLLDTALDGQVTVTLPSAGTSGSPNTLAIADGSASDGRNRMVIFNDGGDLGATAYVQLTPNDAEKIIYIRNDLAGSRSIILFQGTYNASNDYEVPAGTTAVVYFDGAGSGAVAANVFNNAYFDSLRLGGVSVTAIIDDDTMATASATNIATSESIKAYVDTQVGANNELSEVLANGNTTGGTDISVSTGDDITFADSSKAIFGAGSDLQIYHDGSRSIIQDNGTGNLRIQANNLELNNADNSENYLFAANNGAVTLYYDNAEKLATTSTGIDVTGSGVFSNSTDVTQSFAEFGRTPFSTHGSLLVSGTGTGHITTNTNASGNSTVSVGATRIAVGNGELDFYKSGSTTAGAARTFSRTMGIATNGDITFYDTSGNASFVYDESAGSTFNEQGDNKDFRVESDTNTHMLFVDAGNNRVAIGTSDTTSSGNLIVAGSAILGRTSTTTGDFFSSGGGNTSVYNGIAIMSNSDAINAQSNTSLSSWIVDVGGRAGDGITFPVTTQDSFSVRRVAAGGTYYGAANYFQISGNSTVINEDSNDHDFRVESDSNTHALFVDAANSQVVVGTSSPITGIGAAMTVGGLSDTRIAIDGSSSSGLYLSDSGAQGITIRNSTGNLQFYGVAGATTAFNEDSLDVNFRVESDTNNAALFVDGNLSVVGINTSNASSYTTSNSLAIKGRDVAMIGNASSGSLATQFRFFNDQGTPYEIAGLKINVGAGQVNRGQWQFLTNNGGGTRQWLDVNYAGDVIFNEGSNDSDFRVESDNQAYAFFVDASSGNIRSDVYDFTINNQDDGPALTLMSGRDYNSFLMGAAANYGSNNSAENKWSWNWRGRGSASTQHYNFLYDEIGNEEYFRVQADASQKAVVVNDGSHDHDFRVESNANANAIMMDGFTSSTGFGKVPSSTYRVDISGALRHSNYALYEIGQMSASAFYYNRITATGVGGGSKYFEYGIADTAYTSSGAAWFMMSQDDGGTSYFWSDNSGVFRTSNSSANVGGTGGTVVGTQTSDERLKTIEEGFEYGIETVKALQPIAYRFTDDSDNVRRLGFGAQTTQGVVPEAVYDSGQSLLGYDTDPDDTKKQTPRSEETKMMMDGIQLVPVLTKALQEAITKIETLEARIAALETP